MKLLLPLLVGSALSSDSTNSLSRKRRSENPQECRNLCKQDFDYDILTQEDYDECIQTCGGVEEEMQHCQK